MLTEEQMYEKSFERPRHFLKLSYKERWEVIHYIRSLQAASKNLVYSEKANTLNSVDVPYASIPKAAPQAAVKDTAAMKEAMPHSADGHGEKH